MSDNSLLGVIIFVLCAVFLGRLYDNKFKKIRSKLRERRQRKRLAIKQYTLIAVISLIITLGVMFILTRTILE
jgi:hypothetical protein